MQQTKIDRLETHDRFQHFVNANFSISETCQNIVNQRPFGDYPFYLFAHKRELGNDERYSYWIQLGCSLSLDEIPSTRLIWQPRLTKPKAQENSMLFRAYPASDIIKVLWMIPQRELWGQYDKGKMTENNLIYESIYKFKNHPEELEAKEPDDLPDHIIDGIYKDISRKSMKRVV